MRRHVFFTILTLAFLTFLEVPTGEAGSKNPTQSTTAAPAPSPVASTPADALNRTIESGLAGSFPLAQEGHRQTAIEQALNSSVMPGVMLPPMPRTMLELSEARYIETNTGAGLVVQGVGGRVAVDYKYQVKTSVIFFISARSAKTPQRLAETGALPSGEIVVGRDELQTTDLRLFRQDPKTLATYLNVSANRPAVGFCLYEPSLTNETVLSMGFDLMGSGGRASAARLQAATLGLYSTIFQVDADVPIQGYLTEVCRRIFARHARPVVDEDFSKLILEHVARYSGRSSCQPDADSPRVREFGDNDCQRWFSRLAPVVQHNAVPRCKLMVTGVYQCLVFNRERKSCPIYWDRVRKRYTDDPSQRRVIRVTEGLTELPCDEDTGYRCRLDAEPWMALGVPYAMGRATCRRDP
jgi:hypothetical protein